MKVAGGADPPMSAGALSGLHQVRVAGSHILRDSGAEVSNHRQMPARSEITDETPLRLAVAAALAYPDGSMTASGLRKEAKKGRLAIERTAGKDYTTLRAIEEMRQLCRLRLEVRDYGSDARGAMPVGASLTPPCGLSSMESISRAQNAALTIVSELKERSKHISTASTSRPLKKARVIQIKSPSRTF
jgi:hypothetical protein